MTQRVLLHIGLPKTGTTYLQRILWDNRRALERRGIWLPGRTRRDHLWAALECTGADMSRRPAAAVGALSRMCEEIARDSRPTALISHEFFCGASHEQARSLIERLAPAEVELIVTAREASGMLAAGWQELVKNGSTLTLEQAATREKGSEFSWQTWDLGGVLERWAGLVPASNVHILPVPRAGSQPQQHWLNFAEVIGAGDGLTISEQTANASLGAAQVELLRRVTPKLDEFKRRAVDRGEWIRGFLAEKHLAGQQGDRFGLPDDLADQCDARSLRAVELIESAGYRVVGDLDVLRPADPRVRRRVPSEVTDAEMLEVASTLIADLMHDVRELTNKLDG
ncbi:hypothetical protein [Nocardioides montaniterrae]